jgi:phage/plasmid primase-like uncharacterized protein
MHKTGGVTFRPGDLIVPLYAGGELVNLQLINANGSKCFLKGGQVKAACHLIEERPNLLKGSGSRKGMPLHLLSIA